MEKTKKGIIREFSAGGVVCKKTEKGVKILLIKPKGTERWQLPKGRLEEGESSVDAALREVPEETGVKAEILDKVGAISYFYNQDGKRIFKTVTFFLMKYKSGEPQVGEHNKVEVEDVGWFGPDEAKKKLSFKDERNIVLKFLMEGWQNGNARVSKTCGVKSL